MPTVPYSPIPQAGQMVGTPKVGVNTPEAAFGGAVGQAIQGLGKQFGHTGDELFQRAVALQDLRNETDAKNADSQYMMQSAKMMSEFKTLQGQAASPEALDTHIKSLDELRQKIRGDLPNDAARRMYDSSSLSFMGRETINAAIHAAGQQKVAANAASVSRVDLFKQDAYENSGDDISFQRSIRATVAETKSQADLGGWSAAQTSDQINKNVSSLWSHRIVGLARTDPYQAQDMLEAHRKELHPADSERVERTVESQVRNTASRNITREVNADLKEQEDPKRPEKPVNERVNEAREKAERLRPDDPVFLDMVESRVRSDYNRHKTEVKEFQDRSLQTVAGAMNGNFGGKVPTNPDDLVATNPQVAAAWDALDETKKRQLMTQMAKNAKGDVFESPDTIRRFMELKGMAQTDPTKFMEMDPAAQDLPFSQRRALGNLQLELKKKVETDPRVNYALGILKPNLLEPTGITHAKSEDKYNQFVGALQDALEQYQQESKKLPDYKKVLEIGQRLIIDQSTHWYQFKDPFFNIDVPDPAARAIKADEMSSGRPEPTPELTKRIYVRERYKELYGGKDTTSKDQGKK